MRFLMTRLRSAIPSPQRPMVHEVAAIIRPPRARWSRIRPANRPCPDASSAEGRLVQQPDRPPHRQQPGDREPPPLARRQKRGRQMRGMIEPHRDQAFRRTGRLAAQKIPPEDKIFQHAQSRLQRVAMPEVMGLFGQRQVGSPPSRPIDPPAIVKRPAISRSSSEVLPDPLGPMTASVSPAQASKSRPENTSRRPARTRRHVPRAAFCPFTASGNRGYRNGICGCRIAAARLSLWRYV